MRSAHTAQQVRDAEEPLLAAGPEGALMKRASAGLATALASYLGRVYGARVVLLVGAGNNGGDALYAGAALAGRGARVDALLLVPDRAHPAALAAFRAAGGRVVDRVARVDGRPRTAYDVAVDGIVGIGGTGPLRPEAADVVAALEGIPFVAVDVPSGVDVDSGRVEGPHVSAALTVTFGTHKAVHLVDPGAKACGVVELVDIGLDLPPAPVEALQAADVRDLLPVPSPSAHKYTRGVVGVRAGSDRYRGAGVLSVAGAASGLAGMVRFVPAGAGSSSGSSAPGLGVVDLVQAAHPEIVVGEGRVQAWVVGSGGGDDAATQLRAACADGVPVVVDADALAEVSGPLGVPTVLTPHAGELARMLGVEREEVEADQLAHARSAAERYGAVVLLKNRHTLAAHPDGRVRVTTVGPPWLATAGAGDVLGGLVGALLAAGLSPLDAASVGSWLHGAAAAYAGAGGPAGRPGRRAGDPGRLCSPAALIVHGERAILSSPSLSAIGRGKQSPRHPRVGCAKGTIVGMSTQIAVRLPDEMVAFLDRTVATGKAPSRAALVAAAVEREMRRQAAEDDAHILRENGAVDDLDDLVQWSSAHVEVED